MGRSAEAYGGYAAGCVGVHMPVAEETGLGKGARTVRHRRTKRKWLFPLAHQKMLSKYGNGASVPITRTTSNVTIAQNLPSFHSWMRFLKRRRTSSLRSFPNHPPAVRTSLRRPSRGGGRGCRAMAGASGSMRGRELRGHQPSLYWRASTAHNAQPPGFHQISAIVVRTGDRRVLGRLMHGATKRPPTAASRPLCPSHLSTTATGAGHS
jgi:hypothetical protein